MVTVGIKGDSTTFATDEIFYVYVADGYLTNARDDYFYVLVDGVRTVQGTKTQAQGDGIPISISTPGTYAIQIFANGYYDDYNSSNSIEVTIKKASVETDLTIANTENIDVKKFVYSDSNSVTVSIQNILSSSEKTASELKTLVGTASTITWYLDGSSVGTSSIGYTSSPINKEFTLTKGEHTLYAEYLGKEGVNSAKSNKLKFYVGVIPEEYNVSLTLVEQHLSPDSNGVYYVPIGSFANMSAVITNNSLGSNIINYINIGEDSSGNINILDSAKLYLWNFYAQDIVLNPNGDSSVSLAMWNYEASTLNAYAVFEGNDLGLLPAMSNHLNYVYYTDTNITVDITPSNYWAQGGQLVITPDVHYLFANTSSGKYENYSITDGYVDLYINNAKVATLQAGDSYIYTIPSGVSSLSFEARYLGYNITVDGHEYELYKPSIGTNRGTTDGTLKNSMTLRVNGTTEITAAPGQVLNLVSTATNYYNYGTDDFHIYLNGQLYDSGNYYYYPSKMNYNMTFDEVGDYVIFTVYDGYFYYSGEYYDNYYNKAGAVSNNVTIHIRAPQRETTTTVTAGPSESNLGDLVTITPTVTSGSTTIADGTVALYINETFMAYLSPGEKYTYVSNKLGEYDVRAEYLESTFGGYTYTKSTGTASFLVKSDEPSIIETSISLIVNTGAANTTNSNQISVNVNYGSPISLVPIFNISGAFKYSIYRNDSSNSIYSTSSSSSPYFSPYVYESYTYYVKFEGNETHAPSTSNTVTVNVVYSSRATTTTVADISSPVSLSSTVRITPNVLYGSNPVTWGDVEIYLNNNALVNITSGSYYDISASVVGINNITAKYLGTVYNGYNYAESQGTISFTVIDSLIITVSADPVDYGGNQIVKILVKDSNNLVVSGISIDITVNGTTYSESTDSNGVITKIIPTVLDAGNYIIGANYAGSNNYASTSSNGNLVVNKLATYIESADFTTYAYSSSEMSFILKDSKGNLLSGKKLNINLNNQEYNLVTDANGKVSLPVNLATGIYTLTVSFADETNYNSSAKVYKVYVNPNPVVLEVNTLTYSKSESKFLRAIVKSNGNTIGGKIVNFYVNGKVYTATSDSNGIAEVEVNLYVKKTYPVIVRFDGDNSYLKAYDKFDLKVIN